jgi:hypothetical protein
MLINVHQLFKGPRLTAFGIELLSKFEATAVPGRIQKGSRIALAVESPRVSNQPLSVIYPKCRTNCLRDGFLRID